MAVDQDFNDGLAHHQSGRLDLAEACYKRVLKASPGNADALHYLGLIAFQRADFPLAAERLFSAINAKRQVAESVPAAFLVNLGNARKRLGEFSAAIEAYQGALELDPGLSAAWFNLGLLHRSRGDMPAAIEALKCACEKAGAFAAAWLELGECHLEQGDEGPALHCLNQLIKLIQLDSPAPDRIGMATRLGTALLKMGRYDAGLSVLERFLPHAGQSADFLNALGCALSGSGRLSDAAQVLESARAIAPDDIRIADNLASVFKDQAKLPEALNLYRTILEAESDPAIWSNYLFSLLYSDRVTPDYVLAEHQRAHGDASSAKAGAGLAKTTIAVPKRLRIAYLSGDLRNHPVAYFLIGILRHHDPSKVDVVVYDNGAITDEWTSRLRMTVADWHRVRTLSDSELADRIRADDIDVLIDLSGHTAENRLQALAEHPARVQVSYLGYPFSTGLPWIDWRIVDAITDPPGSEKWSSERLYRLPRSYYAYSPPDDTPAVRELPALKNQYLTFGASTNLAKVSPTTLDFWGALLRAYPSSRLLWRARPFVDSGIRDEMRNELCRRGLDPEQFRLVGWASHADRWEMFHEIDIALDTFPYNQATNTCEALWMGVPTISLTGAVHASRMGASILSEVGLENWCIEESEFRDCPQRLHERLSEQITAGSLKELRAGLRNRLRCSRLTNGQDAAKAIEDAANTFMGSNRDGR